MKEASLYLFMILGEDLIKSEIHSRMSKLDRNKSTWKPDVGSALPIF